MSALKLSKLLTGEELARAHAEGVSWNKAIRAAAVIAESHGAYLIADNIRLLDNSMKAVP